MSKPMSPSTPRGAHLRVQSVALVITALVLIALVVGALLGWLERAA